MKLFLDAQELRSSVPSIQFIAPVICPVCGKPSGMKTWWSFEGVRKERGVLNDLPQSRLSGGPLVAATQCCGAVVAFSVHPKKGSGEEPRFQVVKDDDWVDAPIPANTVFCINPFPVY